MNTFKTLRIVLILALAMSLAACGYNGEGAVERRMSDNDGRMGTNGVGTLNTDEGRAEGELGISNTNMHQNTRVEMSEELADLIADMEEVDTANVLLTNQNAYIAVILDDDANELHLNQMNGNRTSSNTAKTRTNNNNSNNNKKSTINKGQKGTTDTNLRMNRQANRDDNRLDNTRMKRQFNQADDITGALKDKITREVKNYAPHILNVYISANPDFADRMNGFIDQLQSGHPVRGFINEVNTIVERMFPTNSVPNITPNMAP